MPPDSANPRILTIIATYNAVRWVEPCFSSLRESDVQTDVLVIDNASSDGTAKLIRKNFPEVAVIESKENLGFGRANNVGIHRATDEGYDYVLLLNQDAWIEKTTLNQLLHAQRLHPDFGLLSPVPYDATGLHLDYLYERVYQKSMNPIDGEKISEIDFINAACWLIHRNVLEKIGGFHPHFFLYGEDSNYVHRLKAAGNFKLGINTSARYFHDRADRGSLPIEKSSRKRSLSFRAKTALYDPRQSLIKTLAGTFFYHLKAMFKDGKYAEHWFSILRVIKFLPIAATNRQVYQPTKPLH